MFLDILTQKENEYLKQKSFAFLQSIAAAAGGLGAIRSGFTTAGIAGIPGATGLSLQQASALATQAAYTGGLPAT